MKEHRAEAIKAFEYYEKQMEVFAPDLQVVSQESNITKKNPAWLEEYVRTEDPRHQRLPCRCASGPMLFKITVDAASMEEAKVIAKERCMSYVKQMEALWPIEIEWQKSNKTKDTEDNWLYTATILLGIIAFFFFSFWVQTC